MKVSIGKLCFPMLSLIKHDQINQSFERLLEKYPKFMRSDKLK